MMTSPLTRIFFVAGVALGVLSAGACTTVREVSDPATRPANGEAVRIRTDDALAYNVAIRIAAPPEDVWRVLVDADGYLSWSSTMKSFSGDIKPDGNVELVVHDAPDQTFALRVSDLTPPTRMVWEDGGSMFLGVRTFTLRADDDDTIFTMEEVFSGGMLGMIEGSLPDFRPSFERFAADLKARVEGGGAAPTNG